MKVSDYRDLMSAVSDQITSVKSAANDQERFAEVTRLKSAIAELDQAVCPRVSPRDVFKADRVIKSAIELIT